MIITVDESEHVEHCEGVVEGPSGDGVNCFDWNVVMKCVETYMRQLMNIY